MRSSLPIYHLRTARLPAFGGYSATAARIGQRFQRVCAIRRASLVSWTISSWERAGIHSAFVAFALDLIATGAPAPALTRGCGRVLSIVVGGRLQVGLARPRGGIPEVWLGSRRRRRPTVGHRVRPRAAGGIYAVLGGRGIGAGRLAQHRAAQLGIVVQQLTRSVRAAQLGGHDAVPRLRRPLTLAPRLGIAGR